MKTIDRFIVREFIRYFIYATSILVFLYIIIDLFEDLGKFIEKNVSVPSLIKYYLLITPSYIVLLMPVGGLMALFCVLGFMTRHREIIALKSAGISIWRLFTPIFTIGLILVIASFIFNETVTVRANYKWAEVKMVEVDKRPRPSQRVRRNFFYYGDENRIFFIKQINTQSKQMHGFTILELGPQLKVKRRIDGELGQWADIWTMYKVTVRDFSKDTTERISHFDSLRMDEIKEKPDDFMKETKMLDQLNILDLSRYIQKKTRAGEDVAKEKVELNYRFSFPFINLILLLLGFPLSLILRRGGVAFGIGLGIIFAFTYWGLIQTFRAYGYAHIINPFLSAWVPNFIFMGAGFILLIATRK
ncbi:MAG: LptF/LptG family permease [candidate division WOR-3 bacterium]